MENRFPHLASVIEKIRGAIPKMHIRGHGEKCQLNCSFTFTKYSGMTCGEGIETAWAEQNHAAGSTKEQSTGHRQDTLDDFNAYWNWTKLHRLCTLHHQLQLSIAFTLHLAKYLLTQCEKYWVEWKELDEDFANLSLRFRPEVIQQWEELETQAFIGRDGKPRSLYQVDSAQSKWIIALLFDYS